MLNPQLLCVSFLLNLKKGRQVWIWLGALSQLKPALVEKPIYGILRKKEKKEKKHNNIEEFLIHSIIVVKRLLLWRFLATYDLHTKLWSA